MELIRLFLHELLAESGHCKLPSIFMPALVTVPSPDLATPVISKVSGIMTGSERGNGGARAPDFTAIDPTTKLLEPKWPHTLQHHAELDDGRGE